MSFKSLKIGLIGAPGSGKFSLAIECSKLRFRGVRVVQNLGSAGCRLQHEQGLAMGASSDYRDSLWCFFKRWEQERLHMQKGNSFVSSGTVVDDLAHMSTRFQMLQEESAPDDMQPMWEQQNALPAMAALMLHSLPYNFIFYLPYVAPSAPADPMSDVYSRRVDAALQELFESFGVPHQALPLDTDEKWVDVVHQAIVENLGRIS